MAIPVALQLYSVRDESAKDFVGTLAKVAEIGYEGVEFAGYGGLSSGELKGHMERLKLFPVGSHVSLELLEKDLKGVIAYCKEIGNPYVVCPWAPIKDLESVKKFAALFNSYGEKLQASGLEFCYHNHDHEFAVVNGRYALDLLFEETDPSLVEIEFDTCWIYAAGADPVGFPRIAAIATVLLRFVAFYSIFDAMGGEGDAWRRLAGAAPRRARPPARGAAPRRARGDGAGRGGLLAR